MILFSVIAATLSAMVFAVAVLWLKGRAPVSDLAREKALYARFVDDVDRRLARGQIEADLALEEKAEAGRALLKAARDHGEAAAPLKPAVVMAGAATVAAISFVLYGVVGMPGYPDQPYAQRLAAWTAMAQTNPDALPPKPMSEVLKARAGDHKNDAGYWQQLGRYQVMAEDYLDGARSLEMSVRLDPKRAEGWSDFGEALVLAADGVADDSARNAFAEALKRDPNDISGLYYTARIFRDDGQFDEAKTAFDKVLMRLPAGDPRRETIAADVTALDEARATQDQVSAQIRGMVDNLSARLKTEPNDPDGWARLLRAHRVLKDPAEEAQTLSAIRVQYKNNPDQVAAILEKAKAPVGREGG
ncbi:c-type cytochrome biogenesis protein CcmI [Asticcacaulis sp. ZE23SCel15]|uniref:c-type cytochrome biogenesis protein CcmI n=1 Tax=Asticcacaulis sp. ZE23SCel15 TaxID=3059027 RepID=UPI00265E6772|nr:c-type cytochrome biogenesis protein CcmI [Asticcacaulis sp. ZE23SCel15]WKL57704.1 c-type cytochrome biogenesis protein CcmI [Asticcacaulis sp. ZE23SCel15]